MTLKELIHDTIMDIFEGGIFRAVKYVDPVGSQKYARMRVSATDFRKPVSCEANEVSATIERPANRQEADARREMREIPWEVHASFDCEIEAGAFLDAFSRMVPSTADTPCFRLEAREAEFVHPPRNEPAAGTYLRLAVVAVLNPT